MSKTRVRINIVLDTLKVLFLEFRNMYQHAMTTCFIDLTFLTTMCRPVDEFQTE